MNQLDQDIVIFGVGRSGTTALFDYFNRAYTLNKEAPSIRYEPFLWSVTTANLHGSFRYTSALSPSGIYAHTKAPLFTRRDDVNSLQTFISDLGITKPPFLVKFIRACGRIDFFLKRWPNAKFIYIFRNPSAVINSVLPMFDFFGSEFHPTDAERFPHEVGLDPERFRTETYAAKQLAYWRAMNEAALLSAKRYPDRLFPVSQEALLLDPKTSVSELLKFAFGADSPAEKRVSRLVGDSGRDKLAFRFSNLDIADYLAFREQQDWYASQLLPICRSTVDIDIRELSEAVDDGWMAAVGRSQTFDTPTRATGSLALRQLLNQKEENLRHRLTQKEEDSHQPLTRNEESGQNYEDPRLLIRASLLHRVSVSLRVFFGIPFQSNRVKRLSRLKAHNMNNIPEWLEWRKSRPLHRVEILFKYVIGSEISAAKYFRNCDGKGLRQKLLLRARGSIVKRVLSAPKIAFAKRAPIESFRVYSTI
jgi:hypothetical protein